MLHWCLFELADFSTVVLIRWIPLVGWLVLVVLLLVVILKHRFILSQKEKMSERMVKVDVKTGICYGQKLRLRLLRLKSTKTRTYSTPWDCQVGLPPRPLWHLPIVGKYISPESMECLGIAVACPSPGLLL